MENWNREIEIIPIFGCSMRIVILKMEGMPRKWEKTEKKTNRWIKSLRFCCGEFGKEKSRVYIVAERSPCRKIGNPRSPELKIRKPKKLKYILIIYRFPIISLSYLFNWTKLIQKKRSKSIVVAGDEFYWPSCMCCLTSHLPIKFCHVDS